MFWLASKLFWLVVQPAAFIGLIVLFGLLLTFSRRKRLGQGLIGLGLVLLFVLSFTNVGHLLLQPLEQRYQRPATFPDNVAGLIVLGGGTDDTVSEARQHYELNESGDRFVEAVRLALAHPKLMVLVSGGSGQIGGIGEGDAKSVMRLFRAFGLTEARIRTEGSSRNTYENAVNSAALLKPQPGERYVLITSAFHMPRSVALFEKAGFDVIPWPVDYRTTGTESLEFGPDANGGLDAASTAIHEWIGLFAYWASGKIPSPWP